VKKGRVAGHSSLLLILGEVQSHQQFDIGDDKAEVLRLAHSVQKTETLLRIFSGNKRLKILRNHWSLQKWEVGCTSSALSPVRDAHKAAVGDEREQGFTQE